MQKTAVSLFDMTGNMVRPLAQRGWRCFCFDIQNEERTEHFISGGSITYLRADLFDPSWETYIAHKRPEIIFSFTPCTDLAVSGAAHFERKLAANPRVFDEAMELFKIAANLADAIGCAYMIENPVSRAATLWRKPDHSFHPYEYGGYLPEDDQHPVWPEYIAARDAYTKKTCLWTGNGFRMPEKRPVAKPEGYSAQHLKLGGKSLKTKNIRSATPRGFAEAMAQELCRERQPVQLELPLAA